MKRSEGQNRYLNGVLLRDYLIGIGAEATKENLDILKEALKEYLSIPSTSNLDEGTFSILTSAIQMIAARESGVEIPESLAVKSMEQLLKEIHHGDQ